MDNGIRRRIRRLGTWSCAAAAVIVGTALMAEEVKIPEVKVAEVNGVWAQDSTTDIGNLTGVKALEGFKARGWVSTYYDLKFGNVANQQLIGGRTFDVHDQSFAVELFKLELEKVPDENHRSAFKLDLGWGDAMDQIANRVTAAEGPGSDSVSGRNIQHATVGYLAPLGTGLRFDVGKMTTHIGAEYVDGIKNLNFSHDYLYTYAIPYNQTGLRMNYAFNEHFVGEFYLLNGWNTHFDNDKGKSLAPSLQWYFGPLSGAVNYMAGIETDAGTGNGGASTTTLRIGNRSTMRQLFDTQVTYVEGPVTLMGAFDYGNQKSIPLVGPVPVPAVAFPPAAVAGAGNTGYVKWYGGAVYAAYRINDRHRPALRLETFVDPNNYTTGQSQLVYVNPNPSVPSIATRFNSLTFTWNWKPAAHLLVRPEFRWDHANRRSSLFIDAHGRPVASQSTIGANAVFFF